MKHKKLLSLVVCIVILVSNIGIIEASSGRTDKYGCHKSKKEGYHCHYNGSSSSSVGTDRISPTDPIEEPSIGDPITYHALISEQDWESIHAFNQTVLNYPLIKKIDPQLFKPMQTTRKYNLSCYDFNSQAEAQRYFVEYGDKILDMDNDGVACEMLSPDIQSFKKRDQNDATLNKIIGDSEGAVSLSQLAFTDVARQSWAYTSIQRMVNAGLIAGKSKEKFAPNDYITIEQALSILGRIPVSVHYYGDKKVPATRAWVAQTLYNALLINKKIDLKRSVSFTDIKETDYPAIYTNAQLGLMNGYGDGSFKPNNTITRAEFVAILERYIDNGYISTITPKDLVKGEQELFTFYYTRGMLIHYNQQPKLKVLGYKQNQWAELEYTDYQHITGDKYYSFRVNDIGYEKIAISILDFVTNKWSEPLFSEQDNELTAIFQEYNQSIKLLTEQYNQSVEMIKVRMNQLYSSYMLAEFDYSSSIQRYDSYLEGMDMEIKYGLTVGSKYLANSVEKMNKVRTYIELGYSLLELTNQYNAQIDKVEEKLKTALSI